VKKEKAFETYSFIHSQANHFPSSLASNAALEAARIHFDLLEEGLRSETNEEVLGILNDLKELQIRKNVFSEPTHLEAALEYAKIRSVISNPEEQDSRYLFFLSRIQDDFNSQEDLVTQDYLVNLNQNSEKKLVFDAYMKFIDAKDYVDSQQIIVGIGFFFTGKKMKDFGPVFEGNPEHYASEREYEEARLAIEGETEKKYKDAKEIHDHAVELIFRQPTLDEVISMSDKDRKLPISLNLDAPEIARVALDWMGEGAISNMGRINKSIDILEKCYIDNTFEDKPPMKKIIELIRSNKDLSMDVVHQFFAKVGK